MYVYTHTHINICWHKEYKNMPAHSHSLATLFTHLDPLGTIWQICHELLQAYHFSVFVEIVKKIKILLYVFNWGHGGGRALKYIFYIIIIIIVH